MRYPYDAISFFIACDIAFVKNPDGWGPAGAGPPS
jgi:hypothetical protein